MLLTVSHSTTYRYRTPVELLPHRLMLTPRSSHNLSLQSSSISTDPTAHIEWTQDVFGNLIATASFSQSADRLTIRSDIVVDQRAAAWPLFKIAPHAHNYPFFYSEEDRAALGALLVPEYTDMAGKVSGWARSIVAGATTDTLSLLQDLSNAWRNSVMYSQREEEGTQTPAETLSCASGTCRDLATLFIESARELGFGARAVSGYLFDPPQAGSEEIPQHGSTHAWAEVYLPCAGWVAFDPTNGRMGEANLIPVANARNITQIKPVDGSFIGARESNLGMDVRVTVSGQGGHG